MDDLMNEDLYALIGTVAEASAKEIKTAYRKKALSCHPDKNPDNPRAAELFHQLSRALEILTDDSARAAYDKVLKARHQSKLRASQLDAKRKKFRDELEAREEAHRRGTQGGNARTDEQKLKAEIERLEKEGSRLVQEEIERINKKITEELARAKNPAYKEPEACDLRVRVKWTAEKDDPKNGGYDYDTLHRILSKYGDISALIISAGKKGSALVEYACPRAADTAAKIESGLATNPLHLKGLWEKKDKKSSTYAPASSGVHTDVPRASTFPCYNSPAPNVFPSRNRMSELDFEASVLRNLREAQERKDLQEKAAGGT